MTQEPAEDTSSLPSQASPKRPRGSRTLCLPIAERDYLHTVEDPAAFRAWLDRQYRRTPELFPSGFERGYALILVALLRSASVDWQLVLSTQSVTFIDDIERANDTIVVERTPGEREQTTLRRLSDEELRDWLTDYSLGEV